MYIFPLEAWAYALGQLVPPVPKAIAATTDNDRNGPRVTNFMAVVCQNKNMGSVPIEDWRVSRNSNNERVSSENFFSKKRKPNDLTYIGRPV